jgi:hypothetical protein
MFLDILNPRLLKLRDGPKQTKGWCGSAAFESPLSLFFTWQRASYVNHGRYQQTYLVPYNVNLSAHRQVLLSRRVVFWHEKNPNYCVVIN